MKLKCDRLRPKSIVDYYREAYIYNAGNIRVTIDSDIRTAVNTVDIFDTKSQCISLLENNTSVLEVKYDEFIPDFILDLVQINKCSSTAVSKYAISRAYV
ncbi:VTC domain protein [Romboutsia lituseburensis]|nr:VTC domain protein [Romboutsia lituseburensis]